MIKLALLDVPPLYYKQELHMMVKIKDKEYTEFVTMTKDVSNKDIGECLAVLLDWKDLLEKELDENINDS